MKNKLRVLSKIFVISLVISLIFTGTSFAEQSQVTSIDNSSLLGGEKGEIVEVYRVTDNGLVKVDIDLIKELKENLEVENEKKFEISNSIFSTDSLNSQQGTVSPSAVIPPRYYFYDYTESSRINEVTCTNLTKRATSYVKNSTSSDLTRTLSASVTTTYSANMSLTGSMQIGINAELGSSWSNAQSFSDSVTVTVKPGYQSWAEFTPIMDNSYGYMDYYERDTYTLLQKDYIEQNIWTDIYIPRKVNGMADGYLTIKTAKY